MVGISMEHRLKQPYCFGISLYTMLGAVVVLGVIAATAVNVFSGNRTKGQALYEQMSNISRASQRFHLDTGCYPSQFDALVSKQGVSTKGYYGKFSNSCDRPISTQRWHGPYVQISEVREPDYIDVPSYGPNAYLLMNFYGSGNRPSVEAHQVTRGLLDAALAACRSNCEEIGSNAMRLYYAPSL